MKNKFNKAFYQEDVWEFVKNKKTHEYNLQDVKHWVYTPCWSFNLNNTECFYSIYQVLCQKGKFKDDIKRIKKSDTSYPLIVIEDKFDAADMDPRITAIFAVVEQKAGNKKRAKELIARAKINGLVPDRIKTWLRGQPAAIKLIEQINEIDSF